MTSYDVVVCSTSHPVYDQRLAKVCNTLCVSGNKVLQIGRSKSKNQSKNLGKDWEILLIHCFFNEGFLFYAEYNLRLFLALLRLKAKIYCANDADTIMACGVASVLMQTTLFYDSHEYFTESPELKGRPIVKKVWDVIERCFVTRVCTFYTVSQSLVEIFEKKFGRQVHLVRNLPYRCDLSIVGENVDSHNEKIILYQGVVNVGRGLHEAIDMMEFLPEYELWIAGEGDISREIKAYAASKDFSPRIKLLGMLKPDDLREVTRKARYGLNLLDSDNPNYYYSLANKFFDYLVQGVPCITMNFPEYAEVFKMYNAGILIDRLNADVIATKIREIDQSDPSIFNAMVANAKLLSEEYNWENESVKLISLYNAYL